MSQAPDDGRSGDGGLPPEVSDYELLRPIGQGGFGQVWLATNRTTGQPRAVKVIPISRSATADPAGREINSITRLEANLRRRHPNLLAIHHVGKTAEHLFYVMDLADDLSGGRGSAGADYRPATLRSLLADGPLPAEQCHRYARQLLAGLASLHEAGMVHRDVKPANCLLVDGELRLADFGLLTEANPQVSRVGTLRYMPPDGHMDARADVYAAGLVIYEMLSGLPADGFPRLGERAREVVEDPILRGLGRVALKACEPQPQDRFRDARAMLAEVERTDASSPSGRTLSRRPAIISVACVLLVLVAAAILFWPTRPERVHVNFVSHPFEATIELDGVQQVDADGQPYTTPCTIEDLPAEVHGVVFKHTGRDDLIVGPCDFAQQRRVEARWPTGP